MQIGFRAAVLSLSLAATSVAPHAIGTAIAQQPIELKVSLFLSAQNPINQEFERWGREVAEKSNGRLVLKMFHSSQMGPLPRQYDLVRTGVADISFVLHGGTPGRFPLTELAHLPGYLTNAYVGGPALTALNADFLAADHPGVKVLYYTASQPLPVFTKNPVRQPSDLRGKRLRAAGTVQSASLEAFGAVPANIQTPDIPDALAKGMIDGAITGYVGAFAIKLQEIAKYVTDIHLGSITFATVMNPKAYESLPPDLRKVIDETTGMVGARRMGKALGDGEAVGPEAIKKFGIERIELSPQHPEIVAVAASLEKPAVAALEAKGRPGKAFLERLREEVAKETAAAARK
ncbi:MAG: TRAP transporter substrate-binding protein [Burkholderiales bacterium]